MNWSEQVVLITGGTGSFGKWFVEIMLRDHKPRKLIVFSRDELKQQAMRAAGFDHSSLRFVIGDVRDRDRVESALADVTVVVHAGAIKQVPVCEENPFEAIQTNVIGSRNVIDAALRQGIKRTLLVSTDKAVNPINLYGATKLCAEKLFVQANHQEGKFRGCFSTVRYGNVIGSRGSVIPTLLEQRKRGPITITDCRMTRFSITLEQGVRFVIRCLERMHGGEIFVPKIPSMRLFDLAEALAPGTQIEEIGIRAGEKLHEVLISEDEARNAVEFDDFFVIRPVHAWWDKGNWNEGRSLQEGFRFASDTNTHWLSKDELARLAGVEQPDLVRTLT